MEKKEKREKQKKKAATPHPLLCCAALNPSTTTAITWSASLNTNMTHRHAVYLWHVYGRRHVFMHSINIQQAGATADLQVLPSALIRDEKCDKKWEYRCRSWYWCSNFFYHVLGKSAVTRALYSCGGWKCVHGDVSTHKLASAVERRETRRGFCNF